MRSTVGANDRINMYLEACATRRWRSSRTSYSGSWRSTTTRRLIIPFEESTTCVRALYASPESSSPIGTVSGHSPLNSFIFALAYPDWLRVCSVGVLLPTSVLRDRDQEGSVTLTVKYGLFAGIVARLLSVEGTSSTHLKKAQELLAPQVQNSRPLLAVSLTTVL